MGDSAAVADYFEQAASGSGQRKLSRKASKARKSSAASPGTLSQRRGRMVFSAVSDDDEEDALEEQLNALQLENRQLKRENERVLEESVTGKAMCVQRQLARAHLQHDDTTV